MDLWSVPVLGAEHNIMQSVWERSAYWSVCMAPPLHIKNISALPNTFPVLKMTQSALLFTAGTVPQTAAPARHVAAPAPLRLENPDA